VWIDDPTKPVVALHTLGFRSFRTVLQISSKQQLPLKSNISNHSLFQLPALTRLLARLSLLTKPLKSLAGLSQ